MVSELKSNPPKLQANTGDYAKDLEIYKYRCIDLADSASYTSDKYSSWK